MYYTMYTILHSKYYYIFMSDGEVSLRWINVICNVAHSLFDPYSNVSPCSFQQILK